MSMGTGEFCNIALSITYVLSTWIIWFAIKNALVKQEDLKMQGGKNHSKTEQIKAETKAVIIASICSVVITTIMACLLNIFVILPFYSKAYGMNIEAIIGMMAATNPYIKNLWTAVIMGIAPFNIIKYGVNSIIICLIYSRLVPALRRMLPY
jgi:riboflavin transporter FmnP